MKADREMGAATHCATDQEAMGPYRSGGLGSRGNARSHGMLWSMMMTCQLVSSGLAACAPPSVARPVGPEITVQEVVYRDPERHRDIPSLLYSGSVDRARPLAIISPGYGNGPEDYDFLAAALAGQGFIVASIDHEIPGDAPLPSTGDVIADRTPSWRNAIGSIRFVRDRLIADGWAVEGPMVLVGHSHGGDASMMMAADYPEEVRAVFSLDNRRHPLPRIPGLRVCSLRSVDQPADVGVLPSRVESQHLDVRITVDADLKHDEMSEVASSRQKARMIEALLSCLEGA